LDRGWKALEKRTESAAGTAGFRQFEKDPAEGWPPLVAGLLAHAAQNYLGFHVPGHKQGRGAWPAWRDLLGEEVFRLDLTELPGLDNLQAPEGIIRSAAAAAAAVFGSQETFFLVNGTTAGILAMLLATCGPRDQVLVPRVCHQAVIHGLILSGASPFYLPVHAHPTWGLPGVLKTEDLLPALSSPAPPARALVLIHPNYYGLAGALEAQIQSARAKGLVTLVDEAHGAHFCAGAPYPVPALRAGADLVAQGAHKVLGAFTQAAFLHHRGTIPDPGKLRQALRLLQSSSPSYLLLASLDVARCQFFREKKEWEEVASWGLELRRKISRIPGFFAPGEEVKEVPGVAAFDPARLIVNVKGLGITGFAAAAWLRRERRILVELADFQNIVFVLGPADFKFEGDLLEGLTALAAACSCGGKTQAAGCPEPPLSPLPRQFMTPRAAFFAPQRELPLAAAQGKIAAEVVAPYPPGVPILCPGEEINAEALAYLAAWSEAGGVWPGREKGTIKIVAGS